jgi:O-antigen ligase
LFAGIIIYAGILAANHILLPASSGGDFLANSVGRPMTHTSGRSTFWQLSIKDAIRHPLLGAGPGHFACDYPSWLPAHPHSFLLRILGEWGMLAGLLLFALAGFVGITILRRLKFEVSMRQAELPLKTVLATSLLAGALHACLSGVMTMPASQVTMILVGGWYLSLSAGEAAAARSPQLARFVPIGGMLAACALLAFAATEVPRLGQRTVYAESYGPMTPRFWQDGRVCDYRYPSDD